MTFVVETAPEPPRTRRRYVAGVAAAAFAILFLGIPSASSTVADPHRCDFLSKGSRDRGDCLAADDTAVALNQASCAVAAAGVALGGALARKQRHANLILAGITAFAISTLFAWYVVMAAWTWIETLGPSAM